MEKVFEIYVKTAPERLWEALTGLKTLLETGENLTTPGSLRYAPGS
jgi:hypothetical protein